MSLNSPWRIRTVFVGGVAGPVPMLVLVAAAALFLPMPLAVGLWLIALAVSTRVLGWRRVAIPGLFLALAACQLGIEEMPSFSTASSRADTVAQTFERLLGELEQEASFAAAELGEEWREPAAAFSSLAAVLNHSTRIADSLQLVDRDGRPVAWSGAGFRHDMPQSELPFDGVHAIPSVTAVTVYAVVRLETSVETGPRAFRVVAGRTFSTYQLPPEVRPGRSGFAGWNLIPAQRISAPPTLAGLERRAIAKGHLELRLQQAPKRGLDRADSWGRRLATLGLLFAVLMMLAESTREWSSQRMWSAIGLGLGVVAIDGAAASQRPGTLLALVVAASCCFLVPALRGAPGAGNRFVFALLIAPGLFATTSFWVAGGPWMDLGTGLLSFDERSLFKIALFVLAAVVCRYGAPITLCRDWGIARQVAVFGLCLAAALVMAFLPPIGGLVLAVPFFALVCATFGKGRADDWVLYLMSLAFLVGGVENGAERWKVEQHWRGVITRGPMLSDSGRRVFSGQMDQHLRNLDWTALALAKLEELGEAQDLALSVWLGSPLAHTLGPSALTVVPEHGRSSSVSFGLPLEPESGMLSATSRRWPEPFQVWWRQALVAHRLDLRQQGGDAISVWYWALPIAQRELTAGPLDTSGLSAALLAGPFAVTSFGGAVLDVFDRSGKREARTVGFAGALATRVADSSIRSSHSTLRADFPELSARMEVRLPDTAGRRVAATAICAASVLLWSAVVSVLVLVLMLSREVARSAVLLVLRSYSRKVVLLAATMLLVPLLALGWFAFRSFGNRMEEAQRENGEKALRAAGEILADYLESVDPGFSMSAVLDDEILDWLPNVVNHEVNLYWRGSVFASSKRELFTSGLLSRRIPGEVYSALQLADKPLASRINTIQPGGTRYRELYKPVELRSSPGPTGLFLSVPLLAQQLELGEEMRRLTEQFVATAVVLLLLVGLLTSVLANSFGEPLRQMVRATEQIAMGAEGVGTRPKEPELLALAEAIDVMAQRIAEARGKLQQEKRVVDTVVANITSAVALFDESATVLLGNRRAEEFLGIQPGDTFDDVMSRASPGLARAMVEARVGNEALVVQLLFAGQQKEWTVAWVPVHRNAELPALLILEDVTEVTRSRRLEAWAEMAKIIAHEIKNPLTPIRLSAEHLRRVYRDAPHRLSEVFERCIDNILTQVNELRATAGEFSNYSQIPEAALVEEDLVSVVASIVDSYRDVAPERLHIGLEATERPILMRLDRRLMGRAVRNLVENAVQASPDGGHIEVLVERRADSVRVEVADRGPGVMAENLTKIFDPSFSTTRGGTGLGLPITKRIAEQHGGTITAENRPQGGLVVRLSFPFSGKSS